MAVIGYHGNKDLSSGAEGGRKDEGGQEVALTTVPGVPL